MNEDLDKLIIYLREAIEEIEGLSHEEYWRGRKEGIKFAHDKAVWIRHWAPLHRYGPK